MRAGDPDAERCPQPPGAPHPPAGLAAIGRHTLQIEAARAGVSMEEYLARLRQGRLYCYGCRDWHPEEAFPADNRRHSGRSGSCTRAILAAVRQELAGRGRLPPAAAVWVVKRLEPARGPGGGETFSYWGGPGRAAVRSRGRPPSWSPALDENVARFPGAGEARDALIAAFGGAEAVPPGCRLVRLA
jgi:hypothetical protein